VKEQEMGKTRAALVVRGGWLGHEPVEATDMFIPYLEQNEFQVRVEESPKIYADRDYMAGGVLVMELMFH